MEKVTARPVQRPQPVRQTTGNTKPKSVVKTTPKPKKLWDNYIEIATVQKSDRLRFVVAACTREGYRCINIREFYLRKRDGAWMPGRDGIVIPVVAPLSKTRVPDPNNPPKLIYPIKEMLAALLQATDIATDMDLEDLDHEIWQMPKVTVEEKDK